MAFNSAQKAAFSSIMTAQIEGALVFANAVNYTWEPDAQFAKSVIINTQGDVTIGDYVSTGSLTLEIVSYTSQSLVLDSQKYFNFVAPSDLLSATTLDVIGSATQNASFGLANAADEAVAALYAGLTGGIYGNGDDSSGSVNIKVGATETAGTSPTASAYDALVNLSVLLDESDAPALGRKVIVPPWYLGQLTKDDRWYSNPQSPLILENGVVPGATVAGMQVLVSNNVSDDGTIYRIMALQERAIAFAGGLRSVEAYNPEDFFGTAIKGLYIFGTKVVQPTQGAIMYAKQDAAI